MAKTLKQQTANAIVWNFIDKFGQQALAFVVWVILSRYFLSSGDYGLIGMLAIFIALSNVLLDSGFSWALIRKQHVSQADLCSVFYCNISISICLYLILFFCAPFIANFYNQPILVPLCRVSSLVFLINSTSLIQLALLTRETDFKHITIANGVGLSCSIIVSFILAFSGCGVWVLVFQNIAFCFVRNIFLWIFSSWRPSLVFDIKSIRGLWGFSSKVIITGILNNLFGNVYALIIGKLYYLKDVGYYTQGSRLPDLSVNAIYGALQSATYPILSKVKDDSERLKRAFRKVIRVTSFVSFPVLFGLAAIASPLVHTLLTEKWAPSIPYIQKLCIAGAFLPLVGTSINILYVKGLSTKVLILEIIRKTLILLCILLTIRLSIDALVNGLVIAHIVGFFVGAAIAGKQIAYKIREQIKDIIPYFVLASLMACAVYMLSYYIQNQLYLLIIQIVSGCIIYLGATYLLGSKIFRDVLKLLRKQEF